VPRRFRQVAARRRSARTPAPRAAFARRKCSAFRHRGDALGGSSGVLQTRRGESQGDKIAAQDHTTIGIAHQTRGERCDFAEAFAPDLRAWLAGANRGRDTQHDHAHRPAAGVVIVGQTRDMSVERIAEPKTGARIGH